MRLAPVLRGVAHALCAVPFAWLVADTVRDALGPDPVAQITHRTGIWALRLLLLTLAVTPLRRLTGRAELVQYRRLLGLWAFFYASTHLATYLVLDLGGFWAQALMPIGPKRTYADFVGREDACQPAAPGLGDTDAGAGADNAAV